MTQTYCNFIMPKTKSTTIIITLLSKVQAKCDSQVQKTKFENQLNDDIFSIKTKNINDFEDIKDNYKMKIKKERNENILNIYKTNIPKKIRLNISCLLKLFLYIILFSSAYPYQQIKIKTKQMNPFKYYKILYYKNIGVPSKIKLNSKLILNNNKNDSYI